MTSALILPETKTEPQRHTLHDVAFGTVAVVEIGQAPSGVAVGVAMKSPVGASCLAVVVPSPTRSGTIANFLVALPSITDWLCRVAPADVSTTIAMRDPGAVAVVSSGLNGHGEKDVAIVASRLRARFGAPSCRPTVAIPHGLDDESLLRSMAMTACTAATNGTTFEETTPVDGWRRSLEKVLAVPGRTSRSRRTSAFWIAKACGVSERRASELVGGPAVSCVDAGQALDDTTRFFEGRATLPKRNGASPVVKISMVDDTLGLGRATNLSKAPLFPGSGDFRPLSANLALWHLVAHTRATTDTVSGRIDDVGRRMADTQVRTVNVFADIGASHDMRTAGYVAICGHEGVFGRKAYVGGAGRLRDETDQNEAKACRIALIAARKAFPDVRRFVVWNDSVAVMRAFHRQASIASAGRRSRSLVVEEIMDAIRATDICVDVRWTKGHARHLDDLSFGNHLAHAMASGEEELKASSPSSTWTTHVAPHTVYAPARFETASVGRFLGMELRQVEALGQAGWLDVSPCGVASTSICLLLPRLRAMGNGDRATPST